MTMKLDTVIAPRKDWNLVVVAGLDSKTVTVFFVVGAAILIVEALERYYLVHQPFGIFQIDFST